MKRKYILKTLITSVCIFFHSAIVFAQTKSSEDKDVIIEGRIDSLKDGAIINLTFAGDVYGAYGNEDISDNKDHNLLQNQFTNKILLSKVVNHSFRFILHNVRSIKYGVISSENGYIQQHVLGSLPIFTIEPGDSILITGSKLLMKFTGRNAAKYTCEYELRRLDKDIPVVTRESQVLDYFMHYDSIAVSSLNLLEKFKQKIGNSNYWLLKGNIISACEGQKFLLLNSVFGPGDTLLYTYLTRYKSPIWNRDIQASLQKNTVLQHSVWYLDFLLDQYKYDSCYIKRKIFKVANCYSYIVHSYSGTVRECLIYHLMSQNLRTRTDEDMALCINDALNSGYIRNPLVKKYLVNLLNTNMPGAQAYNFSLLDPTGRTVKLSDFKNKVLLMDFWFVGCGNCMGVHPYIDSIKNLFKGRDFELVSICIDYTGEDKRKWLPAIASNKYTSPENINLFAVGTKGVEPPITRQYHIKGCPTLLLVDKQGKLTREPIDPRSDSGADLVKLINENL